MNTLPHYRHILFFFLTLFVLFTYGYYFGTFDQASHIPFLKKTVDPSLFPGDKYFDLSNGHFSYFWLLFVPFYKIGLLEISMFVVHILATYTTFWALWRLSKTLFHNSLTSILTVISSVVPHFGFSSLTMFEFSMLNRTVMLPFELFALEQYIKKNYLRVFFILGILYNFHVLSVNFILAMIGFDVLVSFKYDRRKFITVMQAAPLFVLSALPVLVWKASHSGIDFHAHYEWFSLLENASFSHMFRFTSSTFPIITVLTISGISAILVFFFVKPQKKDESHATFQNFMYGGILILLLQFFATYFYPATIIIQSQIIRIGVFMMLFTYLYFAHFVAIAFHKSKIQFYYLLSLFLFSFFAFIPLLGIIMKKWVTTYIRAYVGIIITILLFGIMLVVSVQSNVIGGQIHIWSENTPFNEVQLWAKHNTPKNALFITPPAEWWLYSLEWRVISERSTVSVMSELLEAAFDPSYISYWKKRFEDIAPGALAQFKGNITKNRAIARSTYNANSTQHFQSVAKKYGASYLVIEKKYRHKLPVMYENSEYIVYKL
jgi:hypothetical protein